MKKTLFLVTLLVMSLSVFSQGIKFEEDHNFNNALAKAKQENKFIFLDAYASWCGPCKMMAAKIFPLKEVGDYYNAHFVNLKLDMEAPENVEIAKKYAVSAFPTFLFIDGNGEVVHRGLGAMDAEKFIELAKQAADTDNNAMAITRKIKSGDRSLETVQKYFAIDPYSSENEAVAIDYLVKMPENMRFENSSWAIFAAYVNDPQSEPFQFFLQNRQAYEEKFGKDKVERKLMNMFGASYRKDKAQFENLRSIDSAVFDKMKPRLQMNDAYSAFNKNKTEKTAWDNLLKYATPYMNSEERNPSELNQLAWLVYENYKTFGDKKALATAADWAKRGVEKAPEESAILDTYANILFDLGKKKDAIAMELKALDLAKKAKDENGIAEYQNTLNRFKKK